MLTKTYLTSNPYDSSDRSDSCDSIDSSDSSDSSIFFYLRKKFHKKINNLICDETKKPKLW